MRTKEAPPSAIELIRYALDVVEIHVDLRGGTPMSTNKKNHLADIAGEVMLQPRGERNVAFDYLREQGRPRYQGEPTDLAAFRVGIEIAYAERRHPYKK